MKFDASRNAYIDLENIRITLVNKTDKPTQKDWAGSIKYLRVQAYRNPSKSKALHRGAEFPLSDMTKILDFIKSAAEAGKNYYP
jgi:uncharacterized protein (DUF427 family)